MTRQSLSDWLAAGNEIRHCPPDKRGDTALHLVYVRDVFLFGPCSLTGEPLSDGNWRRRGGLEAE